MSVVIATASIVPGAISDLRHRRVWLMRWQQWLYAARVPEVPDISPWPMRIAYLGGLGAVVVGFLGLSSFARLIGLVLLAAVAMIAFVTGIAMRKLANADRALFLVPFPAALWTLLVNGPIAAIAGALIGMVTMEIVRRRTRDTNGFAPGWLVILALLITDAVVVLASALIHL